MESYLEEGKKKYLENRKVTVKLIPERQNMHLIAIDKDHVGKHIYPECTVIIRYPLSRKQFGLYKLFNEEEREFFERILNREKGDLSFTPRKGDRNYWKDEFKVVLTGDDLRLDLNDPIQNIQYKVLQVDPRVANSYEERLDKAESRWMIIDDEYEEKVNTMTTELKAAAYIELSGLSRKANAKQEFYNILRLLGKTPKPSASKEWMYSELGKIIETTSETKGVVNVKEFLEIVKDKTKNTTKLLILDGIELGEIVRRGTKYSLKGGDMMGLTLEDSIKYLDNKENQEIRKLLEIRIKENK